MIRRIRTWLPKCLWSVGWLQEPIKADPKALAKLLMIFPGGDISGYRKRLPNRRPAVRQQMKWQDSQGNDKVADVSFGFGPDGKIREVFCIAAKDGSDMQSLVHDACIATSIVLQRGHSIADLAKSFGELREEGQPVGKPASIMGALARLGAAVERQVGGEGGG
ncbi:MAG TPA: hypothetical protein VGH23_16290 [Rhizomicrobium sp.]|jgi:hypothetical protein